MPTFRLARPFRSLALSAAVLTLAVLAAAVPARAETRNVERTFDAATLRGIDLENLAGTLTVVAASGPAVRVQATVHAEDSAGESAAALADSLSVDFQTKGDKLVVKAMYPLDRHRRYHYPGAADRGVEDHGWLASWLSGMLSTVRYQDHEVTVTSHAGGSAATLWADFTLEVPAGVALKAKNSIGRVASTGVAADQTLDTSSGDVAVKGSRGALKLDTGSGDVTVADHEGDVAADTGSGDVHFSGVTGDQLAADTGSGDVTYDQVRGQLLKVDTGSGDVHLLDCDGALVADTGSGEIRGRGLKLGAKLRADTGSGDVLLAGDFTKVADLYVDTGSGDVVLDVAGAPNVRLVISTGSGDVTVDMPDARIRKTRGDFVAELGTASGKALIKTGSGDVKIAGH
jgi:hypothetical protein